MMANVMAQHNVGGRDGAGGFWHWGRADGGIGGDSGKRQRKDR